MNAREEGVQAGWKNRSAGRWKRVKAVKNSKKLAMQKNMGIFAS
jgi:hypothetical protein